MSRIAKNPIVLPQGVEVALGAEEISVKGPLGAIKFVANPAVTVAKDGATLVCKAVEGAANSDALSGTVRAILANMVTGVTKGFEKKLNLVGVGYKAAAQGAKLNLVVGYSHPVNIDMPAGIKVETPVPTEIIIKGADRQRVGQIAAEIRAVRPPEPYKGKGIRYQGEFIKLKPGKAAKAAAA